MKSCWVELLYVDVFFGDKIGDRIKVKLPVDKCKDVKTLATYLAPWAKASVAFRRFKYTEDGPEYLDRGWVYFRGVLIDREEILSGRVKETYPDFPLGDTLKQNVKYNNFDIIWFKDYNWAYPFREDDDFVVSTAAPKCY